MKPSPATSVGTFLFAAILLLPLRAAEMPAGFPELPALLAADDEISFLARFCPFLEKHPADRLPALAEALAAGWQDESLATTHRAAANRMVATRQARSNPGAFLQSAGPDSPPVATLAALRGCFARDRDAALAAFRDRAKPGDTVLTAPFLSWLAEIDPALAFAELRRVCPAPAATSASGMGVFRVWATRDPRATWEAINQVPDPYRLIGPRGAVLAVFGLHDEDAAFQLWKDLPRSHEPDLTLLEWFREWGADHPASALGLARRLGSAEAWRDYAATLTLISHEATFAAVLANTPPAMLEAALAGFFHLGYPFGGYQGDIFHRRLHLLERVPDAALRTRLLDRIAEDRAHTGLPMPRGLFSQLTARPPNEVLHGKSTQTDRLVSVMLCADAERALAWLMRLDDPEWDELAPLIVTRWPLRRMGEDGPRLVRSKHPREAALGRQIAEKWFQMEAGTAFEYWLETDPAWLAGPNRIFQLAQNCQRDPDRAKELADRLPEPEQRATAHLVIDDWQRRNLPVSAPTAEIRAMFEVPRSDFAAAAAKLVPLATRDLPAVDELMERLPTDCAGADALRAKRGLYHLRVGRPGRAAAAWRTVGEMNVLYQTIGAHPIDQLGPGGVGEILSLLAAQPVSPKRDEVLKKICQVEVASGRVRALALAADSPDEAVRLTLLESLAEAARTPAHLVAVRSLAGDEPEGKLAVALMDALGRVDPVAAWREAVGLGPDNANARMLADLAMVRLRRTHPEMIPALLAESPQLALINPTCVRDLLIGPARLWPARTFWFARAWLPEESAAVVLPMIATEWARNDSEAACAVCLTLPAGESGRFAAASAALKVWLAKSPDAALKWLGADPARTELLLRNHDLLALAGRERIIPFLTGLPINAQVLESSTIAASELADADYAKAAAFLQTSAVRAREAGIGETQLRSLAQAERAVVTGWLAADPPAASAFIDSLPGPAADPLRSGDSGREFSFRRLAVAKGIPFALGQLPEEDQGRRQAVRGIVAAALGGGGSDGLKAILLAIGKEDGQMGRLRLGQVIAKSYLEYDPDGLLPWLRTLPGTVDHDLLSDAAAVVVSSLRESPWRRQIALAAVRLLAKHPPPGGETAVEPLALRLLFGNKSSPFPTAIAAAHLDGDLPEIPVVKHLDQIVSHLIAGRPAAALPDAAALPSPEFDALLCRILTAIPAAERAAALAALPDSLRPRATAWASVLAGTR